MYFARALVAVLLLLVTRVPGTQQRLDKIPVTCDAGHFIAGGYASVTCHFPKDMKADRRGINIVRYPLNGTDAKLGTNVSVCVWKENLQSYRCIMEKGYTFDNDITDRLVVGIYTVSEGYTGLYECSVVPSGETESHACEFEVEGNSSGQCSAPTVNTGDTAVMTFLFSTDINTSSDDIYAYLRRAADPREDILQCDRNSPLKCYSTNPQYSSDSKIINNSLTVRIPNVTKEFQDEYVLHVNVNQTRKPSIACHLKVQDVGETDTKEGHTTTILIAFVVLLLIIVSNGFVLICYLLKRNASRNTSGHADESGIRLMSIDTNRTKNNYQGKRWYWPEANEEGDKQLVNNFWKNGPGAFLVRPSKNDQANFVLVASFDGTVQHLTLVLTEEGGVMCPSTGESFKTLCQVVKHYRENAFIADGRLWGTLSKPFGRAPEENWYYGRLAVEYEDDVLLSGGRESGSFLIADASTDADAYYLMVNFERRIHRFGIAPNDVGFKMVDTDLFHKTLTELVDYYKHNDIITTGGENFGKLSKPCPKEPDVKWFSETLTIDEETKILHSRRKRPGSFLVSKGVTNPNKYVLAVYFDDEIKRFTVKEESNGFKLQYSEMLFYSWYELVDYYREHDIEVRGNIVGKLSTPLRKEPEESCYIGQKTRMEERDLLLAGTAASGDFLIRDGITDPEAYVLAVNFHGHINHFDIYRENGGFRFCDTDKLCTTLGELVDFYKNTEITVGQRTFGKLVKEVKVTNRQSIIASE